MTVITVTRSYSYRYSTYLLYSCGRPSPFCIHVSGYCTKLLIEKDFQSHPTGAEQTSAHVIQHLLLRYLFAVGTQTRSCSVQA